MTRDRRYVLFALISVSLLISSMQFSMVSVALPDMITSLDAPLRWVGWVITIYSLAQAISMPIAGKLSDELGRRNVFVGGVALFGIASLGAAIAPNVYVLVACRLVQGFAGGSLLPSAYGIVGDAFADDRARAVGMISSVFPIGSIVGPAVGGVIVEHLGWRWTFMVNVPTVVLLVLAALVWMSATERRESKRIDVAGAVFLSLCVLGVVYAFTELSQTEVSPSGPVVAVSLLVGALALVAFLRREHTAADPLVDMRLLRQREFAFVNALNFFYGVTIFGLFSFIPLYAQTAYGMSSSEAGLLLTPRAIAMILSSAVAAYLLPHSGYRKPIIIGLAGMAIVVSVLAMGVHDAVIAGVDVSDFVYVGTLVGLTGLAFGITGPAANNAAIELAPDRIAAITGLRGMFRALGGTLGTSVIILVVSRAPTAAQGLERSFLGIAVVSLITIAFVFGIPDEVGGGTGSRRRKFVAEPGPGIAPGVSLTARAEAS